MAESIDSLYISLGLNLSELETDLIAADRTVTENISRLSRETELIKLRAQVEIAGLDETADAERILRIRTDALNQQMTIQRDRVRILDAQLRELSRTQGENSISTQRASIRLERERLALGRLEREVREVTSAISELSSTGANVSISGGVGVSGASSGSGGSGSVSGGSSGDWTDLLPFELPTTKIAAFTLAIGALGTAVSEATALVQETLEDFKETEKQAYELNLDFNDAENFLRQIKLGGGDIGDFEGYIRGITDAYVKGEYDDPEFIALSKYGAEITDENGRLKNFTDLTEELYQAWKKADAAGEGIEFLQLTGGEAGVRDAIQFFKRYEEAAEDAEKIFDANLDDEQWHELERAFNLLAEQQDEFKGSIANLFTPAAQATAEKFFQVFHDGTEWLVENKDAIQRWGFIASEVFEELAPKVEKLFPSGQLQTLTEPFDKLFSDFWNDYGEKINPESPASKLLDEITNSDFFKDNFFTRVVERAEEKQRAYNGELEGTTAAVTFLKKGLEALSDAQKKNGDVLSQYGAQRVKQFKDEIEDLKIELEFGDDEYQKSLAQLKLQEDRELTDKLWVSEAEREAITEAFALKRELIEKEHADKIAEHWQNAADMEFEITHTAFEKQIRDIELWKEAQLEKAEVGEETAAIIAEAASKEAEAFEREVDRIKNLTQSLEDKIFEQEHSQYENDLRKLQQERLKYYEEGMPADLVERYYQNAVAELNQRASKGGDYTKSPDSGMQRGNNGITVIGGDQIIDDGLIRSQQQTIELMTDENRIRAQLMANLSAEARETVERIQATKELTAAQRDLISQTQVTSGFQLIEGDRVVEFQPQLPTESIQQFDSAIEQTNPLCNSLTESLQQEQLPDYFKNLADGAKSVSEMQLGLTNSTMELIDAQSKFIDALNNFPAMPTNQRQESLSTDGFMKLTTSTEKLSESQNLLARIPMSRNRESGFKLGFDYDTAKDIALTGAGIGLGTAATGVGIVSVPALIAGTIASAIAGGLAKGTYDETTATSSESFSDIDLSEIIAQISNLDTNVQSVLQALQDAQSIDASANNFSELLAPLSNLDTPLSSILQQMQDTQPYESDQLQELFGVLPNIEADTQSILQEMQTREEATVTLETIVTPLNNIEGIVQNILTSLSNRESPSVTVSPNLDIDLGGAYVFDEAMKASLVEDITNQIVAAITSAVEQATSKTNYSFAG